MLLPLWLSQWIGHLWYQEWIKELWCTVLMLAPDIQWVDDIPVPKDNVAIFLPPPCDHMLHDIRTLLFRGLCLL